MVIIGGLLAVLAVLATLYQWLLGHWFARILMTPLFSLVLGYLIGEFAPVGDIHPLRIICLLVGLGLGWIVSGLPIRYWRSRSSPILAQVRV